MCDDIQTPQVFQLIGTTSAFSRLEHLFSGVNHDYFSHYTETNVSTTPSHATGEHLPRRSKHIETEYFILLLMQISSENTYLIHSNAPPALFFRPTFNNLQL